MFRDHGQKLAMTFNIFTQTLNVKPPQEELEEIYRSIPDAVAMKNRGLYADFFKSSWHSPFDADVKRAVPDSTLSRTYPSSGLSFSCGLPCTKNHIDDFSRDLIV